MAMSCNIPAISRCVDNYVMLAGSLCIQFRQVGVDEMLWDDMHKNDS